jgi:hypothetical protein
VQVIAVILFWALVTFLATGVLLMSFVMQGIPRLRAFAGALRSGTLRSVAGALVLQILSLAPFIVLLLLDWSIQYAARRFGAGQDTAIWVAMPVGIPALLVPPVATLLGAYLGFRTGWLMGMGRDPVAVLSGDPIAKRLQWLGQARPDRW